jgi:hypothetical protein
MLALAFSCHSDARRRQSGVSSILARAPGEQPSGNCRNPRHQTLTWIKDSLIGEVGDIPASVLPGAWGSFPESRVIDSDQCGFASGGGIIPELLEELPRLLHAGGYFLPDVHFVADRPSPPLRLTCRSTLSVDGKRKR